MNTDELERRTREQIRELQEEYRQRVEPLQKILADIYAHKSMPHFVVSSDTAKSWGFILVNSPEYKETQKELNRCYRAMIDSMPIAKGALVKLREKELEWKL
jgi:hypothetical protein